MKRSLTRHGLVLQRVYARVRARRLRAQALLDKRPKFLHICQAHMRAVLAAQMEASRN